MVTSDKKAQPTINEVIDWLKKEERTADLEDLRRYMFLSREGGTAYNLQNTVSALFAEYERLNDNT